MLKPKSAVHANTGETSVKIDWHLSKLTNSDWFVTYLIKKGKIYCSDIQFSFRLAVPLLTEIKIYTLTKNYALVESRI
jgi:hypothetical protein